MEKDNNRDAFDIPGQYPSFSTEEQSLQARSAGPNYGFQMFDFPEEDLSSSNNLQYPVEDLTSKSAENNTSAPKISKTLAYGIDALPQGGAALINLQNTKASTRKEVQETLDLDLSDSELNTISGLYEQVPTTKELQAEKISTAFAKLDKKSQYLALKILQELISTEKIVLPISENEDWLNSPNQVLNTFLLNLGAEPETILSEFNEILKNLTEGKCKNCELENSNNEAEGKKAILITFQALLAQMGCPQNHISIEGQTKESILRNFATIYKNFWQTMLKANLNEIDTYKYYKWLTAEIEKVKKICDDEPTVKDCNAILYAMINWKA